LDTQPCNFRRCQDADRVSADSEKRHIAQVEEAGETNHNVEPDSHKDKDADHIEHLGRIGPKDREGQDHDDDQPPAGVSEYALAFRRQRIQAPLNPGALPIPDIGHDGKDKNRRHQLNPATGEQGAVEDPNQWDDTYPQQERASIARVDDKDGAEQGAQRGRAKDKRDQSDPISQTKGQQGVEFGRCIGQDDPQVDRLANDDQYSQHRAGHETGESAAQNDRSR
jgi:hypothetical protein